MDTEHEPNPYAAPAEMSPFSSLGSAESLHRVATGLNLVYWGIGIIILSALVGFIGGVFFVSNPQVAFLFLAVVPIGVILGSIVGFVGRLFCLAVPPQTEAQGLIYGAVVCDVIAVLMAMGQFLSQSPYLKSGANLLSLMATILFLLFLKKISEYVGRQDLADKANSIFVIGLLLFAIMIGGLLGMILLNAPFIMIIVGLAMLVLGLLLLVRYLQLLRELRLAILSGGNV